MLLSGHQPNYLPYPGLIGKIMFSDKFVYVTKVQFEKKSWQNRNRIKGANGEILLTIPILSKGSYKQCICDTRINNDIKWGKKHFSSINFNYKKSKYYNNYITFFEELYKKNWDNLCDLDIYSMNWILDELGIKTKIYYDKDFTFRGHKSEMLVNMCKEMKCEMYLSNKGSMNYIEIKTFVKADLSHRYVDYLGQNYEQCFGEFIPHLSIIDMLFNLGNTKTRCILDNINNYWFSEINRNL